MEIWLIDIVRALLIFGVGSILLVEIVGYFWHRFAEHNGFFGNLIRYKHWVHHEVDYPVGDLRPIHREKYKDSGSWSWYALAGIVLVVDLLVLPWRDAIPLAIGSAIYGQLVVNYFHSVFHLKRHFLHRFAWFRHLIKLHDIHHWTPGNYGIVFFFMDRIFGTLKEEFPRTQEDVFRGYKG